MSDQALQIIARGPRAVAEAAAQAVDADILLEGTTYSILEEDEDKDVWRIDAFPTTDAEADHFVEVERIGEQLGALFEFCLTAL